MDYWDTSALAKLYVPETDSAQFAAHLAATRPAVTSELTRWELFRVLARKESEGSIPVGAAGPTFERFLSDVAAGGVRLVAMDATLEIRFRNLVARLLGHSPAVLVRTFDGIHLATAEAKGSLTLVATDGGLRKAATANGMKLFP